MSFLIQHLKRWLFVPIAIVFLGVIPELRGNPAVEKDPQAVIATLQSIVNHLTDIITDPALKEFREFYDLCSNRSCRLPLLLL